MRTRARARAAALVSLLLPGIATAVAETGPSLATRAARFAPVAGAVAEFTQEREVSIVEEVLHARGTLALAAPDALRLDLVAPQRLALVARGGEVAVLDETGAVLPFPPEFSGLAHFARELTDLLLGGTTSDRFHEAWEGADAVTLSPRGPGGPFTEIALRFASDGPLPREIVLREQGGDRTTIRLTSVQLNPPLDAARFHVPTWGDAPAAASERAAPRRPEEGLP